MLVFTNESYVNQNHQSKFTYQNKDERTNGTNQKTGKGRHLVILHAITPDGPLCERDDTGYPVCDLLWKGDTLHPQKTDKLTCKTLWMASSSSGDYHHNMNSDMFMLWVKERLVPTFKKLYLNQKMVLITNNVPYHHKREIGLLGNKKKGEICDMMEKYDVEYINLPCDTMDCVNLDEEDDDGVQHRGEYLQIPFNPDEQRERGVVRVNQKLHQVKN